MDKTEELKKQFTEIYCWPDGDVHYAGFKRLLKELLDEYAQQVINEGKYCIHCGEIMAWNKHKIWCNVFKNQQ